MTSSHDGGPLDTSPPESSIASRFARRPRQLAEVVRRDGLRVVTGTALSRGGQRLLSGAQPFDLDVRTDHILAPTVPELAAPVRGADEPLTINWVTNPPSEGSGGMGTLMRSIGLLEARGHTCRIYVMYQGARRDLDRDTAACRQRFPLVRAVIADVARGMEPADAVFATAWPTAYVVRASATPGRRFYFVQDFEPMFYPTSSNSVLAEETYRFGFHGVTAGPWLAGKLEREYGMSSDSFDLGVDLDCYRFDDLTRRDGIVFYARPDTARRGFELGMLALELFARENPAIDIHLIGQDIRWHRPTFRYVNHGTLSPPELAAVYNRCSAGLVLSLTNLSLLPAELLASGCVPVMNDGENTRASFDNPYARFVPPNPEGLARSLTEIVRDPDPAASRAGGAASVGPRSWDLVGDQLEQGIRRGLRLAAMSSD